ncbi:MAG: acetate kinase [Acholeplasmataceae bacterium]|nr:acetate kinase [Acholeplasmataceae bacterium]
MKIMAVNAGSSSLKFQLLKMPEEKLIAQGLVERIGNNNAVFNLKFNGQKEVKETPILNHAEAVNMVLDALLKLGIINDLTEIEGVGHRVVQGGEKFLKSTIITEDCVNQLEALNDLAPLHNPANIVGIRTFLKILPKVKQVAIFDTTFHTTMPAENFLYATPYEWYEKYGIRKYGFHGTSHQFVSQRAIALLGNPIHSKIIVLHLGNGASISAVLDGKSIDTSMGLTPLEGIPMGTRSGNIDPTLIQFVADKEGKSLAEIISILNKKSGFLGVSGFSNDSRDIVNKMLEGDERSRLAYEIQIKRIVDYVASYYVLLGGADAICFTAGIGENASIVRESISKRLEVLGVELDLKLNELRGENLISTPNSKIKVYVIPTNEEVMIAREVMNTK